MESSRSDQQVLKRDADAQRRPLAFNPASDLCDFQGNWIDHKVVKYTIGKDLATSPIRRRSSAINAVGEFHDAHSRNPNVDISEKRLDTQKDVLNAFAASLAVNENTRVENQTHRVYSHAEASRGRRLRRISLRSSAKPGSRTGL
jgi:organic radical activating enzyme